MARRAIQGRQLRSPDDPRPIPRHRPGRHRHRQRARHRRRHRRRPGRGRCRRRAGRPHRGAAARAWPSRSRRPGAGPSWCRRPHRPRPHGLAGRHGVTELRPRSTSSSTTWAAPCPARCSTRPRASSKRPSASTWAPATPWCGPPCPAMLEGEAPRRGHRQHLVGHGPRRRPGLPGLRHGEGGARAIHPPGRPRPGAPHPGQRHRRSARPPPRPSTS